MNAAFYIAAAVAVIATAMTITRTNAMHALLYLIVSLIAVAVVFYVLGAPFAALLEVIVYAGAIMVLFVFAVMMLNMGEASSEQERAWLSPKAWLGPALLSAVLLAELLYVLAAGEAAAAEREAVGATVVAALLFGPYLLAVEAASMLLLAGVVGAYRLGRIVDARTADRGAETAGDEVRSEPGPSGPAPDRRRAVGA